MASTVTNAAERNRRTLELSLEAFNRHDFDVVRETAAEGYVDHEAPQELGSGFDATQRNLETFIRAFPDIRWEVLDLVTDDRRGAVRLRLTGTHRGPFMGLEPTGRHIDLEGVDYLHFDERGQVTDHWGYLDRLELMQQLGALPQAAGQDG